MKTRFFLMAGLCLALVSPLRASEKIPLLGRWTVVGARIAPWINMADVKSPKPEINRKYEQATFVFGKDSLEAPAPLGCKKVRYAVTTVGPDFLFQGNLTNPVKDAVSLGFSGASITSVNGACVREDADIEMDYAFVDSDTAVFALDNVIYRMKRNK